MVKHSSPKLIGQVAEKLAQSLSPLLAYDSLVPLLGSDTHSRKALRASLSEAEHFPQPRFIGLGQAQRRMLETNELRRSAYVVAATQRITEALARAQRAGVTEQEALRDALASESNYFRQHVSADAQRITSASGIDALAGQYGDVLGWYARDDTRTSPECLAANGKNFRASDPPSIGYPGVVHPQCRCQPGPPHRNGEMLSVPSVSIAARNVSAFNVREYTQRKQVSQKSVNYREAEADAARRCGTCVMYHASHCDLVTGYIEPDHVCDRWEAKPHAVELAVTIRHVRTARGAYFFKEPIGTPITEEQYLALKAAEKAQDASEDEADRQADAQQAAIDEANEIDQQAQSVLSSVKAEASVAADDDNYQRLLAARLSAKKNYPVGHPERVKAERAVRQARSGRSSSSEPATPRIKSEAPARTTRSQPVARTTSRVPHENAEKAHTAQRETDKRLSQGQVESAFRHPNTGSSMSKSEVGDTYEELFRSKGSHLLEERFGAKYRMISHANGGARNTPVDFQLGDKYGGELKTMSAHAAGKHKTAMAKAAIERKYTYIAKHGLKPLLAVQIVNQQTGKVDVYVFPEFASKRVTSMEHIGSYSYTHDDFAQAHARAGYARTPVTDAAAASPTNDIALLRRVWYNDGAFERTQTTLRKDSQKALTNPDIARFAELIDQSSPLTRPEKFYRGVTEASKIFGPLGSRVGKSFVDAGFVAAAASSEAHDIYGAGDWGSMLHLRPDAANVIIHAPAGARAFKGPKEVYRSVADYLRQDEVTFQHGMRWAVLSDKLVNGKRTIEIELIGRSTPTDAMAARLTDDETYQRLLNARAQAKKMYPAGHPRRVEAERAVRQARRVIHGEEPRAPAPRVNPPVRTRAPIPQSEPKPVIRGSLRMTGKITKLIRPINFNYRWSNAPEANRIFREEAESAILRQISHQSNYVSQVLTGDSRIAVTVSEDLSTKAKNALGSYGGAQDFGELRLSPRIFPHVVRDTGGRTQSASFFLTSATPDQALANIRKKSWWVPTDSKWSLSDNVIAHEIGHGINNSAYPQLTSYPERDTRGIPQDTAFWTEFARALGIRDVPLSSEYYGGKSGYLANDVANWMSTWSARIERNVSGYAGARNDQGVPNPREMFAELWSEYTLSSNPRAAAAFYGNYTKRLLNERTAAEQSAAQSLPAALQQFDAEGIPIGSWKNIALPVTGALTVKRMTPNSWDITIFDRNGNFLGSWSRSTPSEVASLVQDIWLRANRRSSQ